MAGGGGGVYKAYGDLRGLGHGGGFTGGTGISGYDATYTATGGTQSSGGVENIRGKTNGSFGCGGVGSQLNDSGGGRWLVWWSGRLLPCKSSNLELFRRRRIRVFCNEYF